MAPRLHTLRAVGVAYLWAVAGALIATGSTGIHPIFGRTWDAVAVIGALTFIALPFVQGARIRSLMVTLGAFVLIAHAIEYLRLSQASPVGISVSLLWLAALIGVVSIVSADQEIDHQPMLEPE